MWLVRTAYYALHPRVQTHRGAPRVSSRSLAQGPTERETGRAFLEALYLEAVAALELKDMLAMNHKKSMDHREMEVEALSNPMDHRKMEVLRLQH